MAGIADKVIDSQNKEEMLLRALERIIQLYTDKSHFVYELLQNAEDAEARNIKFIQYSDRLEVMHDGKPFTLENLKGLCDIGKSDKVKNLNQIGEFGVGFKSVFGICDTVRLYSEPANFRDADVGTAEAFSVEILNFTDPQDIPPVAFEQRYTTRFVFPYSTGRTFSGFKSIAELNAVLTRKLQNLGITTLLFMKNLELIEYEIRINEKTIEGQYLLEKKVINDHCSLVSALGVSGAYRSGGDVTEEISYLMFSRAIDNISTRTVDIAFPVVVKPDGSYECQKSRDPFISVYFPTETESKLGFIVQGPYRTTPNRSSIPADDEDNIRLAKETAILLKESLIEMCEAKVLNMSFVKALPLSRANFEAYRLFEPLYDTVKELFSTRDIIPTKEGYYVPAYRAKIARPEKLATLLPDDLLTKLKWEGVLYRWLPTYVTENSKEYEHVYKYMTSELKVDVVRPEDLRIYFIKNPNFLIQQDDEWLVQLYSLLEAIPAAFDRSKKDASMLTADIIKTSTGRFVAAYRKTESRQYIPNIFLPTDTTYSTDINFVALSIYHRCRKFFDEVLDLKAPDEYDLFIKDIKKRYSSSYVFDAERHVDDIKKLYKFLKLKQMEDCAEEIEQFIEESFKVKCTDGKMHNCFMQPVYMPIASNGISIQEYFSNGVKSVLYVDVDFYNSHGISQSILETVGVQSSILWGENIIKGVYHTGKTGKQPEWWTVGSFRWKFSIDSLMDALKYISTHPKAKDSIIKSKIIFSILVENEAKLRGTVYIGGSTPNIENAHCDMLRLLREGFLGWNGKWLFTESLELVAPKMVSKYEISTSVYGKVKSDSNVYELLGFKKTAADEADALRKSMTKTQLDALFENELKHRFGISSADLTIHFSGNMGGTDNDGEDQDGFDKAFPISRVKNWDALKKHAEEMLCFADPVRYETAIRSIRVSNKAKEARAYLLNMYRYDGVYKYACQMCHGACSDIEATQLFNKPEWELDPMHLCLCPNCAAVYKKIRNDSSTMDEIRDCILDMTQSDISKEDYVVVEVDDQELWFTQTHLAEIQTLIQLANTVSAKKDKEPIVIDVRDGDESGLAVYKAYVGKQLKRKDGFVGIVEAVDEKNIHIRIVTLSKSNIRNKVGDVIQVQLEFLIKNPNIYEVV